MNYYDTLGVDKKASGEAVKRAYRKKAMKHHPDRGGKSEHFHAIQKAYEILSDDSRRAHYDATGEDGHNANSIEQQALQALSQLFLSMLDRADVERTDFVSEMKKTIGNGRSETRNEISKIERTIAVREKGLKRILFKGAGQNFLEEVILGDIDMRKRAIEMAKKKVELQSHMLKLLEEYGYQVEKSTTQNDPRSFIQMMRF